MPQQPNTRAAKKLPNNLKRKPSSIGDRALPPVPVFRRGPSELKMETENGSGGERLATLEGKMDNVVEMITKLIAMTKKGNFSGDANQIYEKKHHEAAKTTQHWWRERMVSEGVKFENMDKRTEADARNRSALGKRLSTTEISGVQGSPRGKFSTPIGKISTIVTRGSSGFFGGQSSFSRDTSRRPLATITGTDIDMESSATGDFKASLAPLMTVKRKDGLCMINPKHAFRMSWDICLVMPLLLYLLVVMPFRLCFMNEAKKFSGTYWFEFMIDMLFLVDIALNFRTGYFVGSAEDDLIEFDPYLVARHYFRGWFFLDIVSGIPFALLDLVFSSSGNIKILKTAKSLRLLRFLKLGRLLKIEKILSNLDRDTLDYIEDFLQEGSTRSGLLMFGLALKTGFICHLLACFWVLVGRIGSAKGMDNWLLYDIKGRFDKSDTLQGSPHVGSIYLASFYFCLTTMTSVGYGDILPYNNTERAFCVLLEFVGAIVFGLTVASLTSVVTSIDINARKTAEELDAVSSFVANRNFPEPLGRRIRRHFRHFYSMKSAIDESKIFGELSTTLRREVSSYLLVELMGDFCLFHSMSPVLWPRLLPLLRPMRFEAGELVCAQGEDCTEMYVMLTGCMRGTTTLSAATKKTRFTTAQSSSPHFDVACEDEGDCSRRILTGDSVNILCALGIWNRCIETVVAESSLCECYTICKADFAGLFGGSEDDKKTYAEMGRKEVMNFRMVRDSKAPTEYGRPLHFTCFSSLQLCLVQGKNVGGHDIKLSDLNPFAVADLVKIEDSEPLGKMWTHRSPPGIKTREPFWDDHVLWSDIKLPFEQLFLRVRIFDSDLMGNDKFLGQINVPLVNLEKGSMTIPEELGKVVFGAPSSTPTPVGRNWNSFIELKESSTSDTTTTTAAKSISVKGKALGPFSDGRHEAWYKLRPPNNAVAVDARDGIITGSIQIWAQAKRAESATLNETRKRPSKLQQHSLGKQRHQRQ